ncbi:RidA family protein [Vaginisenegalia massiliensis]|uniref:RidA family protein n=1 Tax=Vaginisenegalia massiliensis TaxID=2058294 RepID=UPI001F153598|nr:RidA family protein [Vaginisenegalia massiliensis]
MSKLPAAIGPYATHRLVNGLLFTSGQIPLNPETGDLVGPTIEEQTQQVLANLKAVLALEGLDFSSVIKTTVLLTDMADFAQVNAVYAEHFSQPYPARTCYQVVKLSKDAKIEIELIAQVN